MDTDKLQKLIEELRTGNERQRRAASFKLSRSKDPLAVPALIAAYNDNDSSVRQNVLEGLRSIGTNEAVEFLNLHEPEQVAPVAEQPVQTTVQVASNSRRFFNFVIDNIIYEVIMIFAVWPLVRLVFGNSFGENYWINLLFSLSILFLYYFVFETLFQRTPAKLVTSTRVVLENGSKPDIAVIAKRSLCRLVPFEAISLYTGKDPNHKGTWWHDRWTTTRVVKI